MSPAAATRAIEPVAAEPTTSAATRLTYALLVGGFLLAAVCAYILITNAQRLTAARQQLDKANAQLAEVRTERDQVHAVADRMQHNMNLARAGTMYLIDTMASSQDFLADQGRRVKLLCDQTSAGDPAAQQQGARSQGDGMNLGSRYDDADFISFCRAFWAQADWRGASNEVAMQRATATNGAEFDEIAAEYQRLLPNARDNRESARMQEGLAYSRLRQEQFDAASIAVQEAQRLDPTLVLPAITALKIDCARHVEPVLLQSALKDLRARLDAKSASIDENLRHGPNPQMKRALRNAQVERHMVEQDPELYQRCAYAGLTARP